MSDVDKLLSDLLDSDDESEVRAGAEYCHFFAVRARQHADQRCGALDPTQIPIAVHFSFCDAGGRQ